MCSLIVRCDNDDLLRLVIRNAALGLGDSGDRTHPDQVVLRRQEATMDFGTLKARFLPIHVRQVQMSKLHTGDSSYPSCNFSLITPIAVVTSENGGNIRVCGFGSGGR